MNDRITLTQRQKNLVLTLFVTLSCFAFTYVFWGVYFVEYEGLLTGFFSGKLTAGMPFRSLHFIGNIGISFVYSWLYEHFPNIEWLSIIYYFYLMVSSFIGLYLLATLLPENTSMSAKILIQTAVYMLVFADHNIHLIYTRVSYMLCGTSLIALVVYFPSFKLIKQKWKLFVLLNILFTIGCLTRVESATACESLLLFFALFYLLNVKQSIILFLYPGLLIAMLSLGIAIDIKNATEFYKQVEPDIEVQYIERENKVPLSYMKTHRDTVLYEAASNFMWSDPSILTPAYLRSLILPEKFFLTDARQWKRVCRDISQVILKYWHLVLVALFLGFVLFRQYNFNGSRRKLFLWAAFEISFFALLCLQTYTFKVNERSFTPLLSLFILCHILLLIPYLRLRLFSFTMGAAILLLFLHLRYLTVESNTLQTDLSKYQDNFKKIKKIAANRYLVVNSTSFDYLLLSNIPFHPIDFSAFKKVYITDGYVIPFLPYYKRYLESECKCDIYAFPSFWKYIRTIQKEAVIVSNPTRVKVVEDYLKEMYKYPLDLKEDSVHLMELRKSDYRDNSDELKIYQFEK